MARSSHGTSSAGRGQGDRFRSPWLQWLSQRSFLEVGFLFMGAVFLLGFAVLLADSLLGVTWVVLRWSFNWLWFLVKWTAYIGVWVVMALAILLGVSWLTRTAKARDGSAEGADASAGEHEQQHRTHSGRSSGGGAGEDDDQGVTRAKLRPVNVSGASGEIQRILSVTDHFEVLQLSREVSDASEIKRAYRLKQMATHPDKAQGAPGCVEASQRVNAAYDALGDEVRRRQYLIALQEEEHRAAHGLSGLPHDVSFADVLAAFDAFVRETMPPPPLGAMYPTADPGAYVAKGASFRMACSCGYDHEAVQYPTRTPWAARMCTCRSCGVWGRLLPARDGDVWFETSSHFMSNWSPARFIKAYRCAGQAVYDVTNWAKCNGMLCDPQGNPAPTNVHQVPFRISHDTRSAGKDGGNMGGGPSRGNSAGGWAPPAGQPRKKGKKKRR